MKVIKVPTHYQGEDRYCHLVCCQMVLDYYGESPSKDQLVADLEEYYQPNIVHSEGIGIYCHNKGFEVDFYMHDLGVIDAAIYTNKEGSDRLTEAIDSSIKESEGDSRFEYQRSKLKLLKQCIEAGVNVHLEVPDLSTIKKAVDEDTPVITSVKAQILNAKYHRPINSNNHSVVVVGYDQESIWVNDPGAKKENLDNPYPVPSNEFVMGWYMGSARTWIIKPKSS